MEMTDGFIKFRDDLNNDGGYETMECYLDAMMKKAYQRGFSDGKKAAMGDGGATEYTVTHNNNGIIELEFWKTADGGIF